MHNVPGASGPVYTSPQSGSLDKAHTVCVNKRLRLTIVEQLVRALVSGRCKHGSGKGTE